VAEQDIAQTSDFDEVSRHHAEFRRNPKGSFQIIDLGSRRGTYVNGERLTRKVLTEGDMVSIGDATFRLSGGELRPYVGVKVPAALKQAGRRSYSARSAIPGEL
jgi:pSer/pThr/pTyr-binding forkhead associated (FHA) protein